jgi:hypothetical protein
MKGRERERERERERTYRYCAWSGEPEEEGSEVRADGCGLGAIGTWTLLSKRGELKKKLGKIRPTTERKTVGEGGEYTLRSAYPQDVHPSQTLRGD